MSNANIGDNSPFVLTPPEVVAAVPVNKVAGAVKLPAEMQTKIDTQLQSYVTSLLQGDPSSEAFKQKLDGAFSLGRKEIADATTLTNRFTKSNFVGAEDSPAYNAIANMRTLFDELNPATQGDLFTPTTILGIPIPFANKLNRYLRTYEAAETQLAAIQEQIISAKDEIAKDVAEMAVARQQLWTALEKLEGMAYFIRNVDTQLTDNIESLKLTEPDRARLFEQEVLYYVRQNLGDVQAAQALSINAYQVMGELRKTGRETMNGCDRILTLGMAALSIAVTLARATGNQIATQKMLSGSKQEIENLIVATGQALNTHVELTTQFASDPVIGVKTLQNMFDQTYSAMDKMEAYRSEALGSMQLNNQMLRTELEKAQNRISQERKIAVDAAPILSL